MSGLRTVLHALFRRARFERDMADELSFHVERRTEDLMRSGLDPVEARRRACLEFGAPEAYKEDCRSARGIRWLDELGANIRYGLRSMRRTPLFTAIAILSLAIGVGANTAIFSLIDSLGLRPMAIPHVSQIVRLFAVTPQDPGQDFSYPEYLEFQKQAHSLSGLVAIGRRGSELRRDDGSNEDLMVYIVSPNFFRVLGVTAAAGRTFGPEDDKNAVAVLGYTFWARHFGADPHVVGRQIRLNRSGRSGLVTVVGVLPDSFRDIDAEGDRDLWMPPQTWIETAQDDIHVRNDRWFNLLGRLAPGASVRSAQAEISTISNRLAAAWPDTDRGRGARVISDFSYRLQRAGPTAYLMFGVVALVLVLSSVNVANLLLSRGAARGQELAVRTALGAGRFRVVRQLITENVLLGLAGLVAGLALGALLIRATPALLGGPVWTTLGITLEFDSRTFELGVIVALATIVLFGLLPALRVSGIRPAAIIREREPAGSRRFRLRQWLVVSQIAFSVALLSATGVLVRSFVNTRTKDLGITRAPLLVVWTSSARELERVAADRIAALPGVTEVAMAFRAPLSWNGGGYTEAVAFPDRPERPDEAPPQIPTDWVSSNYFRLLGIPILRGRTFSPSEQTPGAPDAVVVNEAMAWKYWPGQNAVGNLIRAGGLNGQLARVVGVVRNSPAIEIGELPRPYLYRPFWHGWSGDYAVIAGTREHDAAALVEPARKAMRGAGPHFDHLLINTQAQLIEVATVQYQLLAELVSALGLIGVLLTAVGLYGIVSWRVTQRRREIGIRMAIGAGRGETVRLVLRDTASMGFAGLLAGIPLALVATRAASSALFGVEPWDPPTFACVVIVLAAVLLLAGFLPARRATRIDPLEALRCE